MRQLQPTSIDDLSAVGHALPETHLSLVAGGARPSRCKGYCVRNGRAVYGDIVEDYTA